MARAPRLPGQTSRERRANAVHSGLVLGPVVVETPMTVQGVITIDAIVLKEYTDSTRPAASEAEGMLIYNSDEPTNPQLNFSDGTNWYDMGGLTT